MSVAPDRETSTQNVAEPETLCLLRNYARHPLVPVRGDGPCMWDDAGRRYLDFIGGIGVNALGQNRPRIVRAINEYQGPLARRIADVSGHRQLIGVASNHRSCLSLTEELTGELTEDRGRR